MITTVLKPYRAALLVGYLLALVGAPILSTHLEWLKYFPLKCPLRFLFGIECPTCGLGRSLVFAFSFQFERAHQYHLLGSPLFALMTVLIFILVIQSMAAYLFVTKPHNLITP